MPILFFKIFAAHQGAEFNIRGHGNRNNITALTIKNPESATLLQLPIISKGRIIQNLMVVAVLTDGEKPTEHLECNCFDRELI